MPDDTAERPIPRVIDQPVAAVLRKCFDPQLYSLSQIVQDGNRVDVLAEYCKKEGITINTEEPNNGEEVTLTPDILDSALNEMAEMEGFVERGYGGYGDGVFQDALRTLERTIQDSRLGAGNVISDPAGIMNEPDITYVPGREHLILKVTTPGINDDFTRTIIDQLTFRQQLKDYAEKFTLLADVIENPHKHNP